MPTTINHTGVIMQYGGSAAADNATVIDTGDVLQYGEFTLFSTAGAMDVFVSLDGTNFSTAPLSLADFGATTTSPVLVTAAGRVYLFAGAYKKIRVLQNGATAVQNAVLNCAPRPHH